MTYRDTVETSDGEEGGANHLKQPAVCKSKNTQTIHSIICQFLISYCCGAEVISESVFVLVLLDLYHLPDSNI